MIFNISQGGLAYISVTAPTGSDISASCQGLTVTGSGSCTLQAPIVGTWEVTCTYSGATKTSTVSVESYGQTYTVTFSYASTITVTTYPESDVTASKTGQTDIVAEADENGVCVLTIPDDGLGEWSVLSEYGYWTRTKTVDVAAHNTDYPLDIALSVPNFTFTTSGGTDHNITKSTGTQTGSSDFKYYRQDNGDWEFYALVNGSIKFNTKVYADVFLLGGGQSGNKKDGSAARGGNGGARKTVSAVDMDGTKVITCGTGGARATTTNGQHSGNPSYLGDYTSAEGTVSAGSTQYGVNGANGGYCFNDSSAKGVDNNSRRVGAGGGHGAYAETDGVTPVKHNASSGGSYGGGAGGDAAISGGMEPYANNGSDATFWGSGGGGTGAYRNTSASPFYKIADYAGAGYKGFVALRNAR